METLIANPLEQSMGETLIANPLEQSMGETLSILQSAQHRPQSIVERAHARALVCHVKSRKAHPGVKPRKHTHGMNKAHAHVR